MLARLRRRHPGSSAAHVVFYNICRLLSVGILKLCFGLRVHRIGQLPREGAVLIVANHQSFLDPPAIGGLARGRDMDFIARSGLFRFGPFGWLITRLNSVPIKEAGGDTAAMKEALRRLGEGKAVLIFPEGSRSADGALHEFKRGVAVLLKRAKCPVIPAAIEGAYDAWPRSGRPRPFSSPIEVMYGDPVEPADLLSEGPDAAIDRLVAEVERMRVELHGRIKARTRGRYPTTPAEPGGAAEPAGPAEPA